MDVRNFYVNMFNVGMCNQLMLFSVSLHPMNGHQAFPENNFNAAFFNCSGLTSVPSLSTLEGVKKYISEMGNTPSAIAPKQTVMLDWVSKEDGTHLLTITVGNKVRFISICPLIKLKSF